MGMIRYRIEAAFERFARAVYRHPVKTVLTMFALIAAVVAQIPRIEIDTSTEGFLYEDDPALLAYNAFRDQFGRDEVIVVAVQPTDVFDEQFLRKLKAFHEELEEEVPHVDDVMSLINARNTRGEGDELIVEDLLEHWPRDETEMATLRERTLSNELYRNLIVSAEGRLATIIIRTDSHSATKPTAGMVDESNGKGGPFEDDPVFLSRRSRYLTDEENTEAVLAVREIAKRYETGDFPIWIAGSPVVTHFLKQAMMRDMRTFVALATATVAICLFLMFRRVSGVILPLLVVMLSLLCTIGTMAILGVPIKVPTQILPSFLLAVGVGTSVHILAMFFHQYERSGEKEDAIAYALGHSGLAVVMTNVTTAIGLLSFSTAEVAPIADLGVFAGIGVLLAFVNTIVLLPALIALVPISHGHARQEAQQQTAMASFLKAVGDFSTGYPASIVVVSLLVMTLSAAAASRIRFSHHPLLWFPEDNAIRVATEKIDKELRGSLTLEVVVDTGKENGLYEPAVLDRIDAAGEHAQKLRYEDLFVGKTWSVTTIIKEINQALNENQAEYYTIPRSRSLVAQELLLFENSGSDDLADFVDSQFSKARFIVKVPFKDAYKWGFFVNAVNEYFEEQFTEEEVTLTGMVVLLARTLAAAVQSMAKSYATALIVITVLMILLIGKVRIGLLSMIPNLAPILLMMGVIGVFSLPMDLFTMMVASIGIGLAVDDTIHFMHNFRRYYEQSGDPAAAVHQTLQTTGRAMLVTSIVLSLGFFIFGFATMRNVVNFGLLTGFTILMALAADYLLAPALMMLVNRKVQSKVAENSQSGMRS